MCKTSDGNSLCLLVPSVPRVPSARAGGLQEVGEGGRGLEGILVPILFPLHSLCVFLPSTDWFPLLSRPHSRIGLPLCTKFTLR